MPVGLRSYVFCFPEKLADKDQKGNKVQDRRERDGRKREREHRGKLIGKWASVCMCEGGNLIKQTGRRRKRGW